MPKKYYVFGDDYEKF